MEHRKRRRRHRNKCTVYVLGLLAMITAWTSCKKQSWDEPVEELNLPYAGPAIYYTVLVDSGDRVFVLGGEGLLRNDFIQSEDNGNSWEIFHFNTELYSNKVLYGGTIRHNAVYAVGFDGKIFRNTSFVYDQWRLRQGDFYWYSHTGIAFGSDAVGCVVGHRDYNKGVIQRIDTAANSYQVDSFPFAINDIAFADEATAYAVGYGAVLRSADSGRSWQQLSLTDDNYRSVYCVDKDNIWTVGFNGTIAHITHNGNRYEKVKNGQNPFSNTDRYLDITFRGKDAYIVGEKGVVLYSKDAGASWQRMKKFTKEDLHGVAIHPLRNTVYFVGDHNSAFRATMNQ